MTTLKNTRAYYIKTKSSGSESLDKEIEDGLIKEVFAKYFELGDEKYIAIGEGNKCGEGTNEIDDGFFYFFLEDYKVNKTLNYLLKHDVVETHKDVTDDIISGDIYDDEDFKSLYFPDSETVKKFKSMFGDDYVYEPEFKKAFDNFILKNVSPDNVLDKINKRGIDSLTDIDKQILNENK